MALLRSLIKTLLPVVVLVLCGWVLWPQLTMLDVAALQGHWRAITAPQWAGAALASALSFWAVAHYDPLAHRHLDLSSHVPRGAAQRAGVTAIALAQTTGFGMLIAALVRWRMLPALGPKVAAQITAFVSVLFMAALSAFTALMCLIAPVPTALIWPALAVLSLLCGLALCALCVPRLTLAGRRIDLPSLRVMAAAFGWAALDVSAAAAAFFMLFPAGFAPDLLHALPIFCLALAAGLFSGTPGGVGPFEVTFLGFTAVGSGAATDPAAALIAILGFRLVYFAIPAVLATGALLILPAQTAPDRRTKATQTPDLSEAARAESAVIRQNGGSVETLGRSTAALWPTAQALVCLFDPFTAPIQPADLAHLKARAAARNRYACLYKVGPTTAQTARRAGWSVMHMADDAVVDLESFTLDAPSRARLRRRLRQASRVGVTVRAARPQDLPQLQRLDAVWQAQHGTARGGTIGRFCPAYLSAQSVFLAEWQGQIVAFASFHRLDQEWALDIMRHHEESPDGTMQALVLAGLEAARARGVGQLSLSAVPACPDPDSRFFRWAARYVVSRAGGPGLRQFKSAFGPRWVPLYAAAPSPLALTIALADITRAVQRPDPLSPPPTAAQSGPHTSADMSRDNNQDEYYEVASTEAA